ncbi:Response regulator ArlR [Geobacillus sp. BCO2]|nr:Response regulator ArlR [Geobacillus sp. BCO2]
MNGRILLIEDEAGLARFLELDLKHEGFDVHVCADGREGLELALSEQWDLILLDVMLPSLNGMEVCRRIRAAKSTPIMMITARDSVFDRVMGLDNGPMTTSSNRLPLKSCSPASAPCSAAFIRKRTPKC